jgi:hypothetical protein
LDATAQAAAAVSLAHGLCPDLVGHSVDHANNTAGVRFGSFGDMSGLRADVRKGLGSGH